LAALEVLAVPAVRRLIFISESHGQLRQIHGGFVEVKFCPGDIWIPGKTEKIVRRLQKSLRES
jgi:hypothetical protein